MSQEKLEQLQRERRERLREGLARVEKLENATTSKDLEKWIGGEIKRYGGRAVELDDAE